VLRSKEEKKKKKYTKRKRGKEPFLQYRHRGGRLVFLQRKEKDPGGKKENSYSWVITLDAQRKRKKHISRMRRKEKVAVFLPMTQQKEGKKKEEKAEKGTLSPTPRGKKKKKEVTKKGGEGLAFHSFLHLT